MDFATIAGLIMQYAPTVLRVINMSMTNEDIVDGLKKEAGPIVKFLEEVGSKMFPSAAETLHVVGGAILAFDANTTKWLQGALNNIDNAGLEVDGLYGPKTKAAIEAFQTKHGLVVDGLAGNITRAAINAILQGLLVKAA